MPKIATDTPILCHDKIGFDVWSMTLEAPVIANQAMPGQFVHLKLPDDGVLLRRPLSIADAACGTLTLIYRVVGKGTQILSDLPEYADVNCLGPLGRGFDLNCKQPLLIGGGMGIAPLLFLAKQFNGQADVLMGGKNQHELFWTDLFHDHVKQIFVTTDDGSMGEKGFTVDLLPKLLKENEYDRIFVCGPQVMMEVAAKMAMAANIPCQVSLEKHMACGIGACLSCTCASKDNGKRKKICTDGPVFWAEEVL